MTRLFYKTTKLERTGQSPLELSLALLSEFSGNSTTVRLYRTVGQYYVLETVTASRSEKGVMHESDAALLYNAAKLFEYAGDNALQLRVINAAGIYKETLD